MNSQKPPLTRPPFPRWAWLLALGLAGVAALLWFTRGTLRQPQIATFETRRGPLDITVMEGGSIRSVDSQEIKCEVRVGYQGMKILKIVEEGYEVTAEDIRTNKVLVELDSSDLQKQIVQQDIQYESAVASLTDAQQNYEIQLNQNLSDIKAAEQKVRFARMDFDKFLGDKVTGELVERVNRELEAAADQAANATTEKRNDPPGTPAEPRPTAPQPGSGATHAAAPPSVETPVLVKDGNGVPLIGEPVAVLAAPPTPPAKETPPPAVAAAVTNRSAANTPLVAAPKPQPFTNAEPAASVVELPPVQIDFSKFASIEALGDGEAKQKLRKFEDDLQVARKEEGQAKATLEGTKRLHAKQFVTRIDLEKDEIAAENARLKVQTATTARDLFLKYEFPKTAEESLSKYSETVRELVRARKAAISKLAQAQAKLKSAQGQYNIQSRQKKELYEQQEKCVIKATQPGLVVYGRGGDEGFFFGGEERIREGATVRERQSIITIPDMSKMSVRVRVHESYIKQVKKGQKARVTVDAYPDKILEGEVTTVGVLPDSQNMWMNPDMKVYLTTITLTGTNEWLKPGMSAKVEILVSRLEDAVYVPLQAVSPYEGKPVCYVAQGGRKPERREVQTGDANDEFIQIKSGLQPGEHVLLRPAETPASRGTKTQKEEPAPPAKPAPGPMQVTKQG